jgi:hypothetical protein
MRNISKAILVLALLAPFLVYAQKDQAIIPNCFNGSNGMVCNDQYIGNENHNGWNWESNQCIMWRARTTSQTLYIGSPFLQQSNETIDLINLQNDFRKEDGWELIRRDFGCEQPLTIPWFILYNKYRGLLRVYFFINNNNKTDIIVTMSSTIMGGFRSAVVSGARPLMLAPDKYLNPADDFDELIATATAKPAGSSWNVAEFTPIFDPNIKNNKFTNTSIRFEILGIVTNNVQLNGQGHSITDKYSMSGKNMKTSSNASTTFNAGNAKKVIKHAKDLTSSIKELKSEAEKVVNNKDIPEEFKEEFKEVIASPDARFKQALGVVVGAASKTNPYLSVAGTVLGILWPSKTKNGQGEPFTPTKTTTTMNFTGIITTQTLEQPIIIRTPGNLRTNNHNLPYYDCPLGIFNIRNQPRLNKINYNRFIGTIAKEGCSYEVEVHHLFEKYDSYRVSNNIGGSFNASAGLELVSSQAAIMGELSTKKLFAKGLFVQAGCERVWFDYPLHHIKADLEVGRVQIVSTEGHQTIIQTPYVDIECFHNMTFNVPEGTKVWVRVKAVLKRIDEGADATPIFYIQDYSIENAGQGTPHNTTYSNATFNVLPPYSNHSIPHTPNFQKTRERNNIINSGSTASDVASTSVTLKPGFRATQGSNYRARIEHFGYGFNITCNGNKPTPFVNNNDCYNRTARNIESLENSELEDNVSEGFNIYPNPSNGNFNIIGSNLKESKITIHNSLGREVYRVFNNEKITDDLEINLSHLPSGIYVIKFANQEGIKTKKILLQK